MIATGNQALVKWKPEIGVILKEGTLAKRIVQAVGPQPERERVNLVYKKLCDCLAQNKMFLG
jgi:glutamate---cysteine ligase / carboxylate-amine ligase